MKRQLHRAVLLAAGPCLMGLHARAEAPRPLPTPFPEIRYQQMSAKSPFAVATAAAPPADAPTPGFAAQLYVNGIAHIGDTEFVAIKSRDPDKQTGILVEVGETTEDGMRVDGIRWSEEPGKSTVDVSKGGEKATLNFDQAVQNVPVSAQTAALLPWPLRAMAADPAKAPPNRQQAAAIQDWLARRRIRH